MRDIAILPTIYTEAEIARQLGVHPETLARERRAGRIAYTTVGGKIRYTAEHVTTYLRDRECATTSKLVVPSGTSTATTPELDPSVAHRLAREIGGTPRKRSPAPFSPETSPGEPLSS